MNECSSYFFCRHQTRNSILGFRSLVQLFIKFLKTPLRESIIDPWCRRKVSIMDILWLITDRNLCYHYAECFNISSWFTWKKKNLLKHSLERKIIANFFLQSVQGYITLSRLFWYFNEIWNRKSFVLI